MKTESVWFICVKKKHNLEVCKQPKLVLTVLVATKSRIKVVSALSSHTKIT